MAQTPPSKPHSVAAELADAELGDARRSARLGVFVERMVAQPDASFPEMAGSLGALEAIYRFLSNPAVTPEAVLEPHIAGSVARSEGRGDVIVAHDTTYFSFDGERVGMGRIHKTDQGFWAHVALAMTPSREVFGVVGLKYGTRTGPSKWAKARRIKDIAPGEPSESLRWPELAHEADARFDAQRAIHVMDREADWFELLEQMSMQKRRFVVRMAHDRAVERSGPRVSEILAGARVVATREVQLSERAEGGTAKERATHPGRKPRIATLEMSAATCNVAGATTGSTLQLNFVHIIEREPPEGCAAVHWTLSTNEPVSTAEEVLRVVDAYRARWTIEEFFKALKTGCAFEKRQLGSYQALLVALAVSLPIAAYLLSLRDMGRHHPDVPAERVLTPAHLAVLIMIARSPIPAKPNARDVMYAIAGLGGHLPRNGDPGWITLGRGLERLLEAIRVLRLAKEM